LLTEDHVVKEGSDAFARSVYHGLVMVGIRILEEVMFLGAWGYLG